MLCILSVVVWAADILSLMSVRWLPSAWNLLPKYLKIQTLSISSYPIFTWGLRLCVLICRAQCWFLSLCRPSSLSIVVLRSGPSLCESSVPSPRIMLSKILYGGIYQSKLRIVCNKPYFMMKKNIKKMINSLFTRLHDRYEMKGWKHIFLKYKIKIMIWVCKRECHDEFYKNYCSNLTQNKECTAVLGIV